MIHQAGIHKAYLYQDQTSSSKEDGLGLEACLKAFCPDDQHIVWKLDCLGRNLKHLVNRVQFLSERQIGFKVITEQGANKDPGRFNFS